MSVRPTYESASGLWPTPNCPNGGRSVPADAEIRGGATPTAYKNGKKMQVGLEQAVKWWPTPTVHGNNNRKEYATAGGDGLATAVKRTMFATPTARDSKSGVFSPAAKAERDAQTRGKPLNEQIGGSLNPTWVEWLMGWPLGWTYLKPWEMDRFRNVQQRHGEF